MNLNLGIFVALSQFFMRGRFGVRQRGQPYEKRLLAPVDERREGHVHSGRSCRFRGDEFRRFNHLPPTGFVALDTLLNHR
jgi:hypothetical protein